MSQYRITAPAFRIPRGSKPVFINDDTCIFLGARGAAVYDLRSRKKVKSVKTCSNASEIAVSESGDWVATKNSSGQIAVSRLSNGAFTHKYKRPPYQDSGQLASFWDDEHFLDSADGVVHLHSAKKGAIVESFQYGNDGWMNEGLVALNGRRQFVAGVTPKFHNPMRERDVSLLHFFDPRASEKPLDSLELPGSLERFDVSPDESRLAAVFDCDDRDRLEVRLYDLSGKLLASRNIDGRNVFFGSPVWTPDGKWIIVITEQAHVLFLDSEKLATGRELYGPGLTGIAFDPGSGMVALTGESEFGGIVLPDDRLNDWSDSEGAPRQQLLADQFFAYSLQIKLRKACPPRAAVFVAGEALSFESERLVGYFRYLPGDVVTAARLADAPAALGQALRLTILAFEDNPAAREATLGPAFPGETDRLVEAGVPRERVDHVRFLGHGIPYAIDHPNVEVFISVVEFDDRLHFWLCRPAEDGKFFECFWPHAHVDARATDEEVGAALLEAVASFPANTKIYG